MRKAAPRASTGAHADEAGETLLARGGETPGAKSSGAAMSTEDLLRAVEASLTERRRAGRGLKFRL